MSTTAKCLLQPSVYLCQRKPYVSYICVRQNVSRLKPSVQGATQADFGLLLLKRLKVTKWKADLQYHMCLVIVLSTLETCVSLITKACFANTLSSHFYSYFMLRLKSTSIWSFKYYSLLEHLQLSCTKVIQVLFEHLRVNCTKRLNRSFMRHQSLPDDIHCGVNCNANLPAQSARLWMRYKNIYALQKAKKRAQLVGVTQSVVNDIAYT